MKRVNATIQINFLCMLLPPPFCAHKTTLNQFIRNWQKSFSIFLQKKTKRTKFFFFAKNNRKIRFKLWYIILYGWRSHILVQDIVINIYRYYSIKCCYYLYEKYDCYDAVLLGLFLLLVLLYSD